MKSAWLILCKEKHSWYVIYKVYWKKAAESFAKEENLAFWFQNEFYSLKNEGKNILMTKDAWLNNRIMYAAQKLICKALGKIDTFRSVLNSQKEYQITHSEQLTTSTYSRYMTETTIGFSFCSNGRVQVCDGLKNQAGLKNHWRVWMQVIEISKISRWKTDITISVCSKLRRSLQLRRICHCICRRNSRWKVSHWYMIWCISNEKPLNFMLSGKRSATFSKSKARWCIKMLT